MGTIDNEIKIGHQCPNSMDVINKFGIKMILFAKTNSLFAHLTLDFWKDSLLLLNFGPPLTSFMIKDLS